jgi:hypothetical protein
MRNKKANSLFYQVTIFVYEDFDIVGDRPRASRNEKNEIKGIAEGKSMEEAANNLRKRIGLKRSYIERAKPQVTLADSHLIREYIINEYLEDIKNKFNIGYAKE